MTLEHYFFKKYLDTDIYTLTPRNILIAFEQVTPVVPQGTFSVMILNDPPEFLSPQKSYSKKEEKMSKRKLDRIFKF